MSFSCEKQNLCHALKPLSVSNVAFHYFPLFGAANYAILSVNVTNPRLLMRMIPSRDVTNILLGNSILGCGLYIYNRTHLKSAAPQMKIMFSVYESLLFNFGSVLLWAVFRKTVASNYVNTAIGLISGVGLMYIGHKYLKYIDDSTNTTPSSNVK